MDTNQEGNLNTEDAVDNLSNESAVDEVFNSPDNFFEALETDVNGVIADVPVEATPDGQDSNITVSSNANTESELDIANKRYSDSSREAQKMKAQLDELKPFIPVLEVMKNDSGLVDTVREYLVNGGQPSQTVSDQLKLSEDFVFDAHEAMSNPDSDSAKVMDTYVDRMVQHRTKEIINGEKKKASNIQRGMARKKQAEEFKQKYNMGDEDFKSLVTQAKSHTLTLEDIYFILNRDKMNNNIANQTKEDMLSQMQNVRNIPQSQSSANNAGPKGKDQNDQLFDSLLGLDNSIDNLFSGS